MTFIGTPREIATNIAEQHRQYMRKTVCVSGHFDPPHEGHIELIKNAKSLVGPMGNLIVIINGDLAIKRKRKNAYFYPLKTRIAIVAALDGVTHVTTWDDGTEHVAGCLRMIRPNFFANGGDKFDESTWNKHELEACQQLNCSAVAVGTKEKQNSSSQILSDYLVRYKNNDIFQLGAINTGSHLI